VGLAIKLLFMIGIILLVITIFGSLVWLWAGGIDYMAKKHPDYKGEDFLDFDKKVNKIAGRDSWDDLHDEIY